MTVFFIIIGVLVAAVLAWLFHRHQRKLRLRAHLMQEAIRNRDFTFRMPTHGMFFGERAMQQTLNQLGGVIRQQINQSEVESWERLTRVLTHEMMNATAPITSISQSLLSRDDVKGTPLEDGIRAIFETSQHMSSFVVNYRKMSELEKPKMSDVVLRTLVDDISKTYPQLAWEADVPAHLSVSADAGMLRQVLMNLAKNAMEADARRMVIKVIDSETVQPPHESTQSICLYVGNDGQPIPAEVLKSIFVPFFTTKRSGSGIGLSLSRRMMIQQGGMLDLAEQQQSGCRAGFVLTIQSNKVTK